MTKKILFGTLAIIGLMTAICVTDNSDYEMLVRFIGVALFFIGSLLGGWFDFQNPPRHGNSTK